MSQKLSDMAPYFLAGGANVSLVSSSLELTSIARWSSLQQKSQWQCGVVLLVVQFNRTLFLFVSQICVEWQLVHIPYWGERFNSLDFVFFYLSFRVTTTENV